MGAEKTQKYKNKANHNSLEILCYSDLGEQEWGGWRHHIETQSLRSYRKWEEKKKCECEGEREREEVESFDFVLILIKSTQSTSDDGRVSRHKPPRGFSPSLTGGAYSTPEHSKVFLHLGPHYGLSFFSTLLTFIPSFLLSAKVEWLQNFEKRAGLPLVGNPSCFAPFLMCVSCRPRLFFFLLLARHNWNGLHLQTGLNQASNQASLFPYDQLSSCVLPQWLRCSLNVKSTSRLSSPLLYMCSSLFKRLKPFIRHTLFFKH